MPIWETTDTFDGRAAATRSLFGWGVVAGPFYLLVAVIHAAVKPGFDFSRHALSLLMVTDSGWIQRLNLILVGAMVVAAAIGFRRLIDGRRGAWIRSLLVIYGVALLGSAIFAPDPLGGFPPGMDETITLSGMLHLVFGAIGFIALGVAAIVFSGWCRAVGRRVAGTLSVIAGIVVIVGFLAGGALSQGPVGVLFLWVSVVAGFAWLLSASVLGYQAVGHPVIARRATV
jgi:hypothetical membrane protein